MAKQEIATVRDQSPTEYVAGAMQRAAQEMASDGAEVSARIMADILAAETLEDVFRPRATPIGGDDRIGVPLRVFGATLNESSFVDGLPAYAVLDCENLVTNQREIVTTGSAAVVAAFVKIHAFDAFPIDVVIQRSAKPTAKGNYVQWLERAAADF